MAMMRVPFYLEDSGTENLHEQPDDRHLQEERDGIPYFAPARGRVLTSRVRVDLRELNVSFQTTPGLSSF